MSLAKQLAARRSKLKGRGADRQRRLPRVQWPTAQALAYNKKLQAFVRDAHEAVKLELLPALPRLFGERTDGVRMDAGEKAKAKKLIRSIADELIDGMKPPSLKRLLAEVGESVDRKQRRDMMHQLGAGLGFKPTLTEPGLKTAMDTWASMNVSLIKTIPESYFEDIEERVLEHVEEGTRWEELAEEIEQRTGVSANRARVIARDQVSKLYGSINMERQEANGITHYFWRTSLDGRVRDLHQEKDGKRFAWDEPAGDAADPADGAFPGDAIQCRCHADPDINGLLEGL